MISLTNILLLIIIIELTLFGLAFFLLKWYQLFGKPKNRKV